MEFISSYVNIPVSAYKNWLISNFSALNIFKINTISISVAIQLAGINSVSGLDPQTIKVNSKS